MSARDAWARGRRKGGAGSLQRRAGAVIQGGMVAESADVTEPARRLPTARRPPWFRRHPRTAIALVASGLTLVLDFATANVLRVTGLVRFDRPDAHYRTLHPTYSHALRPRIA